jgi:hypothetical protein
MLVASRNHQAERFSCSRMHKTRQQLTCGTNADVTAWSADQKAGSGDQVVMMADRQVEDDGGVAEIAG